MLVEDNRGDALLFQRAMKRQNPDIEISVAGTGEAALSELRSQIAEQPGLPNLLIVDINLPGMSGFDFLLRYKADERLRFLPTIMMSSSTSPAEVKFAYDHFASGYLRKPHESSGYDQITKCLSECWLNVMELPETYPVNAATL